MLVNFVTIKISNNNNQKKTLEKLIIYFGTDIPKYIKIDNYSNNNLSNEYLFCIKSDINLNDISNKFGLEYNLINSIWIDISMYNSNYIIKPNFTKEISSIELNKNILSKNIFYESKYFDDIKYDCIYW